MTEFIDSIQLASRSPSKMIHFGCSFGIPDRCLITFDSNPSLHSLVAMLINPYSSSVLTALGLISTTFVGISGSRRFRASLSVRQHCDFPAPAGPMMKTQCRIASSSSVWTTFRQNVSSAEFPRFAHACLTYFSRDSSLFRGGSWPGNRSPSKPKKTTSSSLTIFGMLKSRSARIKRASSASVGSARLKPPATTRTDLIARRPQS
mmetsp:Transcript_11916/g.29155  ORF Transcript_11916/g.29155 Transcript_11916/m.29155 type:complete len:205 (-) Transcript_11916:1787-2401(-)